MSYKEIPVINSDLKILVSDEDYSNLSRYTWYMRPRGMGYPFAYINSNKPTKMHSIILSSEKGHYIDHMNGNKLDNRRENLRYVTPKESQLNSDYKHKYGGSKCTGVLKVGNEFLAYCWEGELCHRIGWFKTEKEAAIAHDQMARSFFGKFARVNYPA